MWPFTKKEYAGVKEAYDNAISICDKKLAEVTSNLAYWMDRAKEESIRIQTLEQINAKLRSSLLDSQKEGNILKTQIEQLKLVLCVCCLDCTNETDAKIVQKLKEDFQHYKSPYSDINETKI